MITWKAVPMYEISKLKSEDPSIQLFRSPFDVPEAVGAELDQNKHEFTLKFRYIGDEATRCHEGLDELTYEIGKNSGRIYSISIKLEKLPHQQGAFLENALLNALHELEKKHPRSKQNYEAAEETIRAEGKQQFSILKAFA